MHARGVEVVPEGGQLSLQVRRIPKEELIQILGPDASDESFHKRMRPGNQRYRLHRLDAQNPKIGLPALELEERVVIKAQTYGQALPADRAIEHAAERDSVYRNGLDSKADDSATELIHDDQNPVRTKQDRIGPEQVQTPQAILGVTEHRQPRRPTPAPIWVVVPGQNAANHILIDGHAKGFTEVLGDLGTAKAWIATFAFTNGLNQCRDRPFGLRSPFRSG